MSYWIQEVSKYRNTLYMCDKAADISKLPRAGVWGDKSDPEAPAAPCCYGSRCMVIEDGTNWVLNKEPNVWTQVVDANGSQALSDLAGAVKGKSAYEIWEEQPDNAGKTVEDFLNSLKGDKGDDGEAGHPGNPGADGKSAYDIWAAKEENTGKQEDEFLESLKGAKGADGKDGDAVTAITLTKDATGAIVSGTATVGEGTVIPITITMAEA